MRAKIEARALNCQPVKAAARWARDACLHIARLLG
jgi:hypothetical protein